MGYDSSSEVEKVNIFLFWFTFRFVHDNCENFGGDPSRITLWGLSAGGAAVSQLLLSPHSRDYAVGGIEMSGSAWNNWVIGHQVVDHSLPLIEVRTSIGIQYCTF